MYVGLVAAFVGIQLVVAVAPEPALAPHQLALVGAALALAASALAVVASTSAAGDPHGV
jgi:hypothetical protein